MFISIGITSRKSHTIDTIDVPEKYFFDFLRGEFDGDGHSHAYWDTRWKSSVSLYINFTCASKKHLDWLNCTIKNLVGVSGSIQYNSRAYCLQFSKHKARVIYESMYYTDEIPYLKRKKEKLDRQWTANELAKQGIQPHNYVQNGLVIRIT